MEQGFCTFIMPMQRFFRYDGNPEHIPVWAQQEVDRIIKEYTTGDGTHPRDEVCEFVADSNGFGFEQYRYDKMLRRRPCQADPDLYRHGACTGQYVLEVDDTCGCTLVGVSQEYFNEAYFVHTLLKLK